MSNPATCTESQSQLTVGQALENISQRDTTEFETLQKDQESLSSLQVTLSDVQKKSDEAEKKLRHKARDLLIVKDDMIHLEQEMQARRDHCACITVDKTKLLEQISEEEEKACMARAQFDIYRRNMVGHREAVLRKMNHTDPCKEEKRTLVQKLRKSKEELKEDLENPRGIKVQSEKREIEALRTEIGELMENIAERRKSLQKELESHVQLKQDIEGQTKRFNAIIKHLHCQISKAQAAHRIMSKDIYQMERQKVELQMQLGSSNDSDQC